MPCWTRQIAPQCNSKERSTTEDLGRYANNSETIGASICYGFFFSPRKDEELNPSPRCSKTKKNVWVKKSRNSLHGGAYHKTACFRLEERQALKGLVIWRISGNFRNSLKKLSMSIFSLTITHPKKARQKTWEFIFCSFVSISVKWRSTLKPKELKMKSYI